MKTKAIEAPRESPESFAALAAAVRPHWHHAVLGLAYQLEKVSDRLDLIRECKERRDFVSQCRDLVETLIAVLDDIDPDPDLEDEGDREDVGDDEPSLGSFERMMDQDKSWRLFRLWDIPGVDAELDDSEREPSLGSTEYHPICPYPGMWFIDGLYRDRSGSQIGWSDGARDDREDERDTGIADLDGLTEQTGGAA